MAGVRVQPLAMKVASKSTAYRPSAYICTITQFWLGRRIEYVPLSARSALLPYPLSSEIHIQPPRSPAADSTGKNDEVVGIAAADGVVMSRALAVAFSCSSNRTSAV